MGCIMFSSSCSDVSIGLNGLLHEGAGVCSIRGQSIEKGSTSKHTCDLVEMPDCYVPGVYSGSSDDLSRLHTTL